jgi:hypothetical protein
MLAERIRWTALEMLVCLPWAPWPIEADMGSRGAHLTLLSLRACQRSEGFVALPFPFV